MPRKVPAPVVCQSCKEVISYPFSAHVCAELGAVTAKAEEPVKPPVLEVGTKLRGRRRPIYPYVPQPGGNDDKTQALWPWYLVPFHEPKVSPECKAYVLGMYRPDDEEEVTILLSELADATTIRADANTAIIQAPGAASSLRQDYYSKGFRLISPTVGEASGGTPFQIWEPQLESGFQIGYHLTDQYVGINDIIKDLSNRMKWSLAQLDAKIAMATERVRDDKGETQRYMRTVVSALRRRKSTIENGLPTAKELQLFFKRFELQRLRAREDQKYREQAALQGRIDDQSRAISQLTSEINAESQWPSEVPA